MKLLRKWRYFRFAHSAEPSIEPASDVEIDVVIPVVEKDFDVLGLCLEGVRRCVNHRIGHIYLVGPESGKIRQEAQRLGTIFVEETSVLGYGPRSLNIVAANGNNRSGWMFQQLLKLSGKVGRTRHFLVIDADHILIRPHTFVDRQGRSVMYMRQELNLPYYEWMSRVMGMDVDEGLSYVAHKMVFDRERLSEMRSEIEGRYRGKRWDRIILETLDLRTEAGFSEYETYGHWLADNEKVKLPCLQKSLHKPADGTLPTYDEIVKRYGSRFRSVTFPDYMKRKPVKK